MGMESLYLQAYHNTWLNAIKKLKGVKGAIFIKTASSTPEFKIQVTVGRKERIVYKIDMTKPLEDDGQYQFIINDLTRLGYGG